MTVMRNNKGYSTRYDADLGGNHIDALRQKSQGLGYFIDFKNRICTACNKRKPVKGGTGIGKRFVCADCKPVTSNAEVTGRASAACEGPR